MTITAEVRGCTVTLHQPPLASGTQGNVTVAFRFDTAWDGYARTAVFRTHGKTVLVLLENDRCALPPEAAAGGDVLLGAFGVCGDATLTTPFARLPGAAGGPPAGAAAAAVPPPRAAQLLAAYRRRTAVTAEAAAGDSAAVRVTEDVDSLHFAFTLPKGDKGDKGDPGVKGDKGDKGDKGNKGDTGDAFTYSDFTAEQLEALKVKGDKGDKGDKGADGTLSSLDRLRIQKAQAVVAKFQNMTANAEAGDMASVTVSGTDVTSAEPLALQFVLPKGDKGDPGDKGEPGDKGDTGEDGYTPVRGTDYWTAEDIAAIKGYVDTAILGGAW